MKLLDGVNLTYLSKQTRIPLRTLHTYKECEEKIPFGRLILIVRTLGIEGKLNRIIEGEKRG